MASQSSFANIKDLRFQITLGQPNASFPGQPGSNTITIQGLRAAVNIENAGGAMMGTLHAQIFGMTASDMNTLTSTLWDSLLISTPSSGQSSSSFAFNQIQVFAIDGSQETLVYNGIILNCWGVYTSMPEVYLMIEAQIGYTWLVTSGTPISIQSDTDIDTVMQQIASLMGFQFENNGVSVTVPKGTYLGNTPMEQARTLMQMYKFWMYLDCTSPNTLAIAPYGVPRTTQITPLVSPQSGLEGYPLFNSTGVNFETKFNPGIVFGGPVQVQSSIPKANGTWTVVSMAHQLSSQTKDGPWKSVINAVSPNIAASLQAP